MQPGDLQNLAEGYLQKVDVEAALTADWLANVPPALVALRQSMEQDLFKATQGRDFMTIMELELATVRQELALVANSPIMKSSLGDAEKELVAAIASFEKLRDRPEEYMRMDREEFPTGKYLTKGLPKDPAHKGIAAQQSRLRDSRKQRLTADDKAWRTRRGQAMNVAQDVHFEHQEKVLGRKRTPRAKS